MPHPRFGRLGTKTPHGLAAPLRDVVQQALGPGFKDLFNVLQKSSRRSVRDRLNLLDLIIFGCCIGDTDRHAKNFSIILTDAGPRLAPGYDLMSALPYDAITSNIAMEIAGKNRADYLERRHWERFAQDVGLAPAATVARVRELSSVIANGTRELPAQLQEEFPITGNSLNDIASRIQERAQRLAANASRGPSAKAGDGNAD